MARPRPKSRVDLLVDSLTSLRESTAALNEIDLRRSRGAVRDHIKTARADAATARDAIEICQQHSRVVCRPGQIRGDRPLPAVAAPPSIWTCPDRGAVHDRRIRTRWGGRGGLGIRLVLRLDQDDDGLGQHAVGRHRLGRGFGLHKGPERVYVIHIGGERHMYRVIRVGVRADVVDAKGPEHLLPERRGQPVRAVLDIVVGDNPWHKASSAHASADRMPERAYPVGLRRK